MLAYADRSAFVQNNDTVGVLNGADPLRNNDDRFIAFFFQQSLAQCRIGLEVKRRKAVVENVQLRIFYNSSGDRKTLFLTARKIRTALRHKGIQAVGQCADKISRLCDVKCVHKLFICGGFVSAAEIFGDRTRKQPCTLLDI